MLTAADARRSAAASALRHAANDVEPIPLEAGSSGRGVLFDRVRLLALAARDAAQRGTPSSADALMALDVPNLLIVAYPIDCRGATAAAERVSLREGQRSPVSSRATPVAADALTRLLPGISVPQGATAIGVNRMSPGSGVVIIYAESPCEREAAIDLEVVPPRKVRNVPPAWPAGVIRSPSSGPVAVHMRATIETDGTPRDVEMISGPSEFNLAAAAAVRQWRYEPMRINGKPSPVPMTVTVSFSAR